MKIGNLLKDIMLGPQRNLRIDDICAGEEKDVSYYVPTGVAAGSPIFSSGSTKGRTATINCTDTQTGIEYTGDYIACDMTSVPTSDYMDEVGELFLPTTNATFFQKEGLEMLSLLKGQSIKIRMRRELPDHLIRHILRNYQIRPNNKEDQ
ncbi:hypothetical protein CMO89_03435 [Candidatus Woesearchaeota archaeon]|nr:hypothetical protein [Candidatus Woesearchaeota archaeon]|tara:strand:- start:12269 stop:12718 length:450 start_codon:yes stop_codon:yes gene_type:complete